MAHYSAAAKDGSAGHTNIYKPTRKRGRGRPPVRKWSEDEIAAFAQRLAELQAEFGLSDEDMTAHLGYKAVGYLRMLKGDYGYLRQPSAEVLRRLAVIRFRLAIWRVAVPFLMRREAAMKRRRLRARKRMGW